MNGPHRNWYLFAVVALALISTTWQIAFIHLSEIDHSACFDNSLDAHFGDAPSRARTKFMSLQSKANAVVSRLSTADLLVAILFLIPFAPLLFANARAKSHQERLVFAVISAFFAYYLMTNTGSPEFWHDCDRKGSDAGFLAIAFIIYLPLMLLLVIALKFVYFRNKKAPS